MPTTFTSPVRLGTRQLPSNDGSLSPSNYGATVVSQQVAFTGGAAASVVVPGGSNIHDVQLYVVTGATTPASKNVTVGGTTAGTVSDAAGLNEAAVTTGAGAALFNNVGTADAAVAVTPGAGSAGFLSVQYTPRNPDGSITSPVPLTNN